MFYNTINASVQLEIVYEQGNEKCDNVVLSVFKAFPNREFTPLEVLDILKSWNVNYLITSVRRAISDLTNLPKKQREYNLANGTNHYKRHLIKLTLKDERYGKPNHKWKLAATPY